MTSRSFSVFRSLLIRSCSSPNPPRFSLKYDHKKIIKLSWANLRVKPSLLLSFFPAVKVAYCSSSKIKEFTQDTMSTNYVSSYVDLGPSPSDEDVIKVADMFYENLKIKELFDLLSSFKDSKNPDLVWRLARADYELSKSAVADEEKKKWMYEAFEASKRALALGDNNFACHKWYAILLDEIGKYEGTKYRLQKSPEVKEHFEKSIVLNPKDPTSHHCLGYWHYSFADLAWYQRKAAAAFFATPPTSTYEEAIKSFEHAEQVQPNFYSMNLLMLGKSYMKTGNYKQAHFYLTKLKDYNAQSTEDKKAKEEGAGLLDEATKKL